MEATSDVKPPAQQRPPAPPTPSAQTMEVTLEQSDNLSELAGALAKAQGAIVSAKKDTANPYFETRYADLASVWDVIREPLSANGLAVLQRPFTKTAEVVIVTDLIHSSGQWVRVRLVLPIAQRTPQGIGSAITYGRRYSLSALVGVASEADDDGNVASQPAADGRATARDYTKDRPAKESGKPVTEKQGVTALEAAAAKATEEREKVLRTRRARLWKTASGEKQMNEETFRKWAVSVLEVDKPSASWLPSDLDKLEQAIAN